MIFTEISQYEPKLFYKIKFQNRCKNEIVQDISFRSNIDTEEKVNYLKTMCDDPKKV